MKKAKILIGVTLALVLIFSGCGGGIPEKSSAGGEPSSAAKDGGSAGLDENNRAGSDGKEENGTDNGESFSIDGSTVQGSVLEFSEDGCTITPVEAQVSGEGQEAIQAAPGEEDPEKNVLIHYQEGCLFQVVKINVAAGTTDFSDASVSDVKKQTSLIIFGEWTDSRSVKASRVYITRYE